MQEVRKIKASSSVVLPLVQLESPTVSVAELSRQVEFATLFLSGEEDERVNSARENTRGKCIYA